MLNNQFKKSLIVALVTVSLDLLFHFFLTKPMETLTYFFIKFLLSFFVASALFSLDTTKLNKKSSLIIITGLIFSTLMSTYYRAWELGEAYVPLGARAPDIIGINRNDLFLFSGTWWLAHALFFIIGVITSIRLKNNKPYIF